MRRRLTLLLLTTSGLLAATGAGAADLGERGVAVSERVGVPVVVDELFLKYPRCRTDRDCIAPRILPIEQGRRLVNYRQITVTVDPRFVEHYAR